jgi:acetyl esterase/lipase
MSTLSITRGKSNWFTVLALVPALWFGGPALAADEAVKVERDVAYLGPDRKEKADLYLPAGDSAGKKRPGVVIIHGGGWISGDKGAAREQGIGETLARNGYVGLSINYVLSTKDDPAVWPRNLHDAKTAVRWLRKNADRLGLDPDHIGAIGGSAGGHLASLLALTGPESGLDPSGPYGEFSCRVQAAVDLYGPFRVRPEHPMLSKNKGDGPESYKQSWLATHIDRDDPPILIIHGTADALVPAEQSREFSKALGTAGVAHRLVIVEGARHSFGLQPPQRDLRPLVLEFFAKNLKPAEPRAQ